MEQTKFFRLIQMLRSVNFLILLLSFFFISCGKKWKKTTEVDFQFKMSTAAPSTFLAFESGSIAFTDFYFEGERKQGKEVSFHSAQPDGWTVDYASGITAPPVQFDIPQGTYVEIELEIENEGFSGATIELQGTYTNSLSEQIPVVFQYFEDDVFYFRAEADNGLSEIVLIEDQPAVAEVIFNVSSWFTTVTANMFSQAQKSFIGGQEAIVISDSENSEIYDLVVSRMEIGNHARFK